MWVDTQPLNYINGNPQVIEEGTRSFPRDLQTSTHPK